MFVLFMCCWFGRGGGGESSAFEVFEATLELLTCIINGLEKLQHSKLSLISQNAR